MCLHSHSKNVCTCCFQPTHQVIRALQFLCVVETPEVNVYQKIAFFSETRHAFGRSALMLSGGATLGMHYARFLVGVRDWG
jgi:hypothetical protein